MNLRGNTRNTHSFWLRVDWIGNNIKLNLASSELDCLARDNDYDVTNSMGCSWWVPVLPGLCMNVGESRMHFFARSSLSTPSASWEYDWLFWNREIGLVVLFLMVMWYYWQCTMLGCDGTDDGGDLIIRHANRMAVLAIISIPVGLFPFIDILRSWKSEIVLNVFGLPFAFAMCVDRLTIMRRWLFVAVTYTWIFFLQNLLIWYLTCRGRSSIRFFRFGSVPWFGLCQNAFPLVFSSISVLFSAGGTNLPGVPLLLSTTVHFFVINVHWLIFLFSICQLQPRMIL